MSKKRTFVVYREPGDPGTRVLEALKDLGHASKLVGSLGEARQKLRSAFRDAVLLIHLTTSSRKQIAGIVRELIAQKEFSRFPLLFVSSSIAEFEGVLQEAFGIVSFLETPYTSEALLEAIKGLDGRIQELESEQSRYPESTAQEASSSEDEKKASRSTPSNPSEPETTSSTSSPPQAVESNSSSLGWASSATKSSLHQLLSRKGIASTFLDVPIGGEHYVAAFQPQHIFEDAYLPKAERVAQYVHKVTDQAGKWEKGHIHRTAFFAYRVLQAMEIPLELSQSASGACLVWSSRIDTELKSVLRKDYMTQGSQKARGALCSQLKDSALWVMSELGQVEMGKVLSLMGKIVGGEECSRDDENLLAASAVLVSDLADRTCWQRGYWNPKAAHSFLRRIAKGEYQQIHPAVVCCAAKFLIEAVTATPVGFQAPKKAWKSPESKAAFELRNSGDIFPGESRIPLPQLAPGMRLSRPLITFDGRQVLEEDVLLDDDLIWRIWNLATVRLLDTPVVFTQDPLGQIV